MQTAAATDAGKVIYARNVWPVMERWARHGQRSSLWTEINGVTAGQLFWFITKGSKDNGMPSWASLPEEKRWQVVTYVEALTAGKAAAGLLPRRSPKLLGPGEGGGPRTRPSRFRSRRRDTRKIHGEGPAQALRDRSAEKRRPIDGGVRKRVASCSRRF